MTNHWIDLRNTDCALIIGSNAAENHPISFKWLEKARTDRGAKIISVDPRYTRTSSKSDIYSPLRSGTDIAFIGGMINYVLDNELYFKDYVVNYTNAAFVVDDGYKFEEGLFSGYDEKTRSYKQDTWVYKNGPDGKPLKDPTLKDPRCVLQLMKAHYSRYDVDTVAKVTGAPKDTYLEVCKAYGATGKSDKSGTILYAMGGTQHTVGSQNVRSYAVLQLLLGNIGVPGGGVNALRGESNVQGSTDFGLLFHNLPGYINTPSAEPKNASLEDFLKAETPKAGFKVNTPKWMVSYLKAFWGPAANKDNDFAFHYLPKKDPKKNYSHIALFEAMYKGDIKGAFLWGQNPIVGGPNATKEKDAMKKLDWLVSVDLWPTESSYFWSKDAGSDPNSIATEVFVLPACASFEKEGSISSSGRWVQWRWQATKPVGESKADLEIMHLLATRLKKAYAGSQRPEDTPIRDLYWNYGEGEECNIDMVAKEINGYVFESKKQLKTFNDLKDDGSTACGNWIMSGYFTPDGNMAKRRNTVDKTQIGQYLEWAWAWPANRRILYNRASADLNGKPWSKDKAVIWWDDAAVDAATGKAGKWVGKDVPDFKPTCPPNATQLPFVGNQPFIMNDDGMGGLFARKGMKEGPFPEHYEPWESPVNNLLNPKQLNPVVKVWEPDKKSDAGRFPYVATTYRVSEHWQTGVMTRNLPWQCELVPEMYIEISKALADKLDIKNAGNTLLISPERLCTEGLINENDLANVRSLPGGSIDFAAAHELKDAVLALAFTSYQRSTDTELRSKFETFAELTPLLISVIAQREGVPFPAVVEVLIMEITFEILREAGVRMPKVVGQMVSIVGALVIGQAAAEAGIISNIMIIVVAITAIANFVAPNYTFASASRLIRFILILASSVLGFYGVIIMLVLMVAHLSSLRSFGVPYLAPVAPFIIEDQKDVLFRFPFWALTKRPTYLKTEQDRKVFSESNPSPPPMEGGDAK